jgi:hypothetical protein
MSRRVLAFAAVLAPAAVLPLSPGCATEKLPEDICSWLADDNNCYARFANDVGQQCGRAFVANSDPVESADGYFQARDDLSICVRKGGGQVIFDPPLDLTAFPLEQVSFKMLDGQALPCGEGSFQGAQTFSVKIESVGLDGGLSTASGGGTADGGADTIIGGTFSIAQPAGRETLDISCPGGLETHHFNRLMLSKCSEETAMLPTAVLESSPGIPESSLSAGKKGYARLRVSYPTEDGASTRLVEYFSCTFPAPPHPCADGIKNHDETGIDCGGSCATERNQKCPDGSPCVKSTDCQSGICTPVAGIYQCGASGG